MSDPFPPVSAFGATVAPRELSIDRLNQLNEIMVNAAEAKAAKLKQKNVSLLKRANIIAPSLIDAVKKGRSIIDSVISDSDPGAIANLGSKIAHAHYNRASYPKAQLHHINSKYEHPPRNRLYHAQLASRMLMLSYDVDHSLLCFIPLVVDA